MCENDEEWGEGGEEEERRIEGRKEGSPEVGEDVLDGVVSLAKETAWKVREEEEKR